MCVDLIGSTVISQDYEFFDVMDFNIKNVLNHPIHILVPSQRLKNVSTNGSHRATGGVQSYSPSGSPSVPSHTTNF